MSRFFVRTNHKILCLKQQAECSCQWTGRRQPVLRSARNDDLTPNILYAEKVDSLRCLSHGNEVALAAVTTALLIWLSTAREQRLDACLLDLY
jgi:hypothetical protein